MANENDIIVKLVLDDELTKQFNQAASKVQADAKKAETAVANIGGVAKNQAAAGVKEFSQKAGASMNETAERVGAMSAQVTNLGTNVISGNLGGAMQSVTQLSVSGFKAMSAQALLSMGAISLAVGAVGFLAKKIQEHYAEIAKLRTEAQTAQNDERALEVRLMKDGTAKKKEESKLQSEIDKKEIYDKWNLALKAAEVTGRSQAEINETYKYMVDAANERHADRTKKIDQEILDNKIKLDKEQQTITKEKQTAEQEALQKRADAVAAAGAVQIAIAREKEQTEQDTAKKIMTIEEQKEARRKVIAKWERQDRADQRAEAKETIRLAKEKADAERLYAEQTALGVGDMLGAFAQLNTAMKGDAEVSKALAMGQAVINTAVGVTKAYAQGGVLGLITGISIAAAGAAQIATISAQKFAKGGDFVTNGAQLIMVGDNPGGKERVQVTPMSSPNYNGPQGGSVSISMGAVYISGSADSSTVKAIEGNNEKKLRELRRMLKELNYAGQSV